MLRSFTVTNQKNESLKLELSNPWKSGLVVFSVDGLGPPKANVSSLELASADGSLFTGIRAQERQIIFNLGLLFNPTVEASRHLVYKYFPIKQKIRIEVETDERLIYIEGYVESCEPNIFSKEESVTISVLCPDPWFYKSAPSSTSFSGVIPMFEFPLDNPVGEFDVIMGEIRIDRRAIIFYEGDVETGMIITIHMMDNDVTNITLYNVDTQQKMVFNTSRIQTITGAPLKFGDDIIVSTIPGKKSCQLLRGGNYTNIISALNRDADWLTLTPGDNIFSYTAATGDEHMSIQFEYRTAYGGI